ncbi:MAG: bifunctional precorrin-2 dehydrogenase/sirohydrochlorin ferrochelatase [Tagaea sp.]
MIPINLDPARLKIALVGNGERIDRREALLREGGAAPVRLPADADFAGFGVVYVADLPRAAAAGIAARVRAAGALVNVEDEADLCDFHTPAIVRRGDLTLSVATGGRCPGLAGALAAYLGRLFDGAWAMRLDLLESKRRRWRGEGLGHRAIRERIEAHLVQAAWLPALPAKDAASDLSHSPNNATLRNASLAAGQTR